MRSWLYFIFVAAIIAVNSLDGLAYSCGTFKPEERFNWADLVFTGKVKDISECGKAGRKTVIFQVEQIWKGAFTNEVAVNFWEREDERLDIDEGERFVVYAKRDEEFYFMIFGCGNRPPQLWSAKEREVVFSSQPFSRKTWQEYEQAYLDDLATRNSEIKWNPDQAYNFADEVYYGQVKAIGGLFSKYAVLRVQQSWKGIDEDEVVVDLDESGRLCGTHSLAIGAKYAIYNFRDKYSLIPSAVNQCLIFASPNDNSEFWQDLKKRETFPVSRKWLSHNVKVGIIATLIILPLVWIGIFVVRMRRPLVR